MYEYTICNVVGSSESCMDATAAEVEQLELSEFQGAMDLADDMEFARGTDADGKPVKVYRRKL